MSICKNCTHIQVKQDGPRTWIWHNLTCSEFRRVPKQDPVTGKWGFASKNDLGRVAISDQEFEYCRDVNIDGKCVTFEAA